MGSMDQRATAEVDPNLAGLSWLLPGILVRAAVRDWTRGRGIPYASAAGITAGTACGLALLLASATLIGP
jgi:hypothetical protein